MLRALSSGAVVRWWWIGHLVTVTSNVATPTSTTSHHQCSLTRPPVKNRSLGNAFFLGILEKNRFSFGTLSSGGTERFSFSLRRLQAAHLAFIRGMTAFHGAGNLVCRCVSSLAAYLKH